MSKKALADDTSSSSPALPTTQACNSDGTPCTNDKIITVVGGPTDTVTVGMDGQLPSGVGDGTFNLTNTKDGVLQVKAGTADNSVAYGQRVALGANTPDGSSHNNVVTMTNRGTIEAEAGSRKGRGGHVTSGMRVDIAGENNTVKMLNDGSITAYGYRGATYINPGLGDHVGVFGMGADVGGGSPDSTGKNTIALTNGAQGTIRIETNGTDSKAYGIYALSHTIAFDATLTNDGTISADVGGANGGVAIVGMMTEAAGMRLGTNGGVGVGVLTNNGTITATARIKDDGMGRPFGTNQAAHGMQVVQAGATSTAPKPGRVDATLTNSLGGVIKAVADGTNSVGAGMSVISTGGGLWSTLTNKGRIDVESTGANGTAYGMYLALGKDNVSKNVNQAFVSNSGIINVKSETAHQLYVTGGFITGAGTGTGTAHMSLWNLSPVAGVADNQKVFAVADGATLNLGDGNGKGAQLILRTNDAGSNGHTGAAVSDLIYNNGGTVTGVIDTVYSGGNIDGKDARLYQATLEGYHDYTNQSVYIDRAWQFNDVGDSKSGVTCATASCALYSSTQGLGLVNAGTLDVAVADAVGAGMYANLRTMRDIENKAVGLFNSGTINVTADGSNGKAYGAFVRLQDGDQVANISNTGTINVTGATAHQLYVMGEPGIGGGTAYMSLWNLAPVAGVADNQKVFAVADGATLNLGDGNGKGAQLILRTNDAGSNGHTGAAVSDLIYNNGGTVTGVIDTVYSGGNIDGNDARLYQATLEGYHDYTNQSVHIDRAWQFNDVGESKSGVICATASCALYSSTQGLGLVNAGTLDVAVADAVGAGMYANLRTMRDIENKAVGLFNSGTINVTADGSNGKAYGAFVRLQDGDQVANISNTGTINVTGATAHQLYVMGEPGIGGGTANIKTWNLELHDRVSGSQSVFAVADGATLNFDKTHMMLRPGDVVKGYEDNKKFNVKDMVYNYGNGAQVTGQLGSVSTPLPMLKASHGLVDQTGTNQWDNQWVSLDVDASESDGPTIDAGVVDSMQSQVDRVGNLLVGGGGGGGIGLGDGDLTSVQLKIYYGNQQRRGIGAAVTDSTGAVAYADYEIGAGHTLGWHGGVEYAHLRAKSQTLNINSLSAIFGGQGRYNFSDTTYLRAQVSGILSHNNNHFNAFDSSTAKVSSVNFGAYGAVYAGYDYKPDEDNTITPELGISALWSHTPSLDVKYKGSPDLNHRYASQNYSAVYANAGVRWTGGIDINGMLLKPTVMAGVRQTLGDGKVKSSMTYAGNRFDTSITRDRTMGIVDVGASTTISTGFDAGLNYRGEYGSNTTNHVGYLNGTIRF